MTIIPTTGPVTSSGGGAAISGLPALQIDPSKITVSSQEVLPPVQADALEVLPEGYGSPTIDVQFPDKGAGRATVFPATIDNLKYLLAKYGITVRFNVIKKDIEINIPGHSGTVHNRANVAYSHVMSLAARHCMSTGNLQDMLVAIADSNPRNPAADWITSRPWDGVSRLPALYATVTAEEGFPEPFKQILMRKFLLSMAAAALMPDGFRSRGVLTFQGRQGLGKTTWFGKLVSDVQLREEVVKLGHAWDGGSKDARISATQHWLVEWGELEGSFRREIDSLKAYITQGSDKLRPPYMRTENHYPRQTVFAASVNQREFLKDATGNSRFWTLPVTHLDFNHAIDMQQVFAELKVQFDAGAPWWLSEHEEDMLTHLNQSHRDLGATGDRVRASLDLERRNDPDLPRMTSGDVLAKLGYDRPTNSQSKECSAVLREFLGEPTRSKGYNYWRVPLIVEVSDAVTDTVTPWRKPDAMTSAVK